MKIPSWDGSKVGKVDISEDHLGSIVKGKLLRSAVLAYEANKRQGTAKTKTRGETAYTTRKPYRQKGTGNARRGDFNSPILRGGGTIFGPRPRSYRQAVPRKALREALRSALLGKVRDNEVVAVSASAFTEPSTKTAFVALAALGAGRSAVVVVPTDNPIIWKSFRNLPRVEVVRASDLNAYHVLAHDWLVLVDDAWTTVLGRIGDGRKASDGEAA